MKKHNRRFRVKQLKYIQEAGTVAIPCRIIDKKTGIEPERTFLTRKSAKRFCKIMNKLDKDRR